MAVVLIRKFGRDDSVLFLSPARVAERSYAALPISYDEVASMVPVHDLKAAGLEKLRTLPQVKNIIRATVKTFQEVEAGGKLPDAGV